MLTKLGPPLVLNHEVEIDIEIQETALCYESLAVEGLVVQLFGIPHDEFLGIFGKREARMNSIRFPSFFLGLFPLGGHGERERLSWKYRVFEGKGESKLV